MPSSAPALTSVILAGKRDSRCHSTTSFAENVVVTKTSYQMLQAKFYNFRLGEGLNSLKSNSANSSGESKVQWSFPGVYFSF